MNQITHHLSTILTVISAIPFCQALQGWPRSGTIVQGNAVQFSQATWDSYLSKPNATGSYAISGFDISKTYPGTPSDGWKLSINVSSNIPDSATLTASTNASGQAFTGTSVSLAAPAGVRDAVLADPDGAAARTTWKICVSVVSNWADEANAAAAADDGTCGTLPAACVTDLRNAWADVFARDQDCYKQPDIPSSCGGALSKGNLTTQQFPITSLNGTEVFVSSSAAHATNDNAALTSGTARVWPVVTVWGWNLRANVSDGTKPTVQLSCIRANTVTPGSNLSSSGYVTRPAVSSSTLVAFITIALVVLLL